MDTVFGVGAWSKLYFETLNPSTVFSATNTFVFLDGSNDGADALNTFLNGNGGANLTLIQNWVSNGGTLLLNAAPNVGGNINFGFGGVTLNYPAVSDTDNSTGPTDPIFSGPYGAFAGTTIPTSQTFTGGYFNHGELSGGGTTALLIDSNGQPSCAVIPSSGRARRGRLRGHDNGQLPFPSAPSARTPREHHRLHNHSDPLARGVPPERGLTRLRRTGHAGRDSRRLRLESRRPPGPRPSVIPLLNLAFGGNVERISRVILLQSRLEHGNPFGDLGGRVTLRPCLVGGRGRKPAAPSLG